MSETYKKFITKANEILPITFCFTLPLHQLVSTVVLVIWLLVVLLGPKKVETKPKELFLLPLMFVVYAIGIVLSENQDFSILERKLSLVAFPIIFLFSKIDQDRKERILKFFIYGLFFACVFCLIRALVLSTGFENGEFYFRANVQEQKSFFEAVLYGGNYFFGNHLSYFHQTVYFSLYLCTGVLLLINGHTGLGRIKKLLLLGVFGLFVFLLSNKAGMLCLVLVIFHHLMVNTQSMGKKSLIVLAAVLIGLVIFKLNPRFGLSLDRIQNEGLVLNKSARYDYTTRILSWDASLRAVVERPILGYGPGDAQNELNKVYAANDYREPLKRSLNSHNQYLQFWLEMGLGGFVLFVLALAQLFRQGLKEQRPTTLVMGVFICLLITGLFESYFNRYSGLSFFCFWWCLTMATAKLDEYEN